MKAAAKKSQIKPWDCDGLCIYVRGSTFHVRGTVREAGRSLRVRETLELPATKENRKSAEHKTRGIIALVRAKLGGKAIPKQVSILVNDRFKRHIGPTDRRILQEFAEEFTTRFLFDIPPTVIVAFVDDRHSSNAATTRERYISTISAFLKRQVTVGQYPEMPEFVRDQEARNPATRARRDVQQFRVELLEDIIDAAHITIGIQLRIEFVGGTRVSSVLQRVTLGNLKMDPGRMTLVFPKTKNKTDVTIALPESMRKPMEEYLAWRMKHVRRGKIGYGSNEPLFLTYKGVPYRPNDGAWGTQNKAGFNAAKKRAAKVVAARYDEAIEAMAVAGDQAEVERLKRLKVDDLALLRKITQHWLRHKFATDIGRQDLVAAKKQGGWKDTRSVLGYLIDDAEHQRGLIDERGSPGSDRARKDGSAI